MFGAIEAGGTKFVCGIGTGPGDLKICQFPTTSPAETMAAVISFFKEQGTKLKSIGIGSFGPIDINQDSSTFGYITSTPKAGWQDFDLVGSVQKALNVPVVFDTDVNAAALGEGRWGAASGQPDFLYLTIGTGIGGGAVANGQVIHGLLHPEMGHIRVPRDPSRDSYTGCCPYHGACLEGLSSGPSMQARWKMPAETLPEDHVAWALEAHYLALGVSTLICTLSPRRVILGGGVMKKTFLFPMIRQEVVALLNGYIRMDALANGLNDYIVPALLGDRAGILGAIVLAEQALKT